MTTDTCTPTVEDDCLLQSGEDLEGAPCSALPELDDEAMLIDESIHTSAISAMQQALRAQRIEQDDRCFTPPFIVQGSKVTGRTEPRMIAMMDYDGPEPEGLDCGPVTDYALQTLQQSLIGSVTDPLVKDVLDGREPPESPLGSHLVLEMFGDLGEEIGGILGLDRSMGRTLGVFSGAATGAFAHRHGRKTLDVVGVSPSTILRENAAFNQRQTGQQTNMTGNDLIVFSLSMAADKKSVTGHLQKSDGSTFEGTVDRPATAGMLWIQLGLLIRQHFKADGKPKNGQDTIRLPASALPTPVSRFLSGLDWKQA